MEQVIDWLNENELRSYPLMTYANKDLSLGTLPKLPDDFLLDLQLIAYTGLGSSIVSLTNITRTSTALNISFGISSPASTITTFSIPAAAGSLTVLSYPHYVRNADGCLAVFGAGAATLYNACTNATNLALNIPIEPALCVQFNDAWLGVQSIVTNPEKLGDTANSNTTKRTHPKLPLSDVATPTQLTGDVQLLEGYNFKVNINNSLIDLGVGANFGLTMDCSTSFLPSECLDCDKLVSYINGIPPDASGNFRLLPGSNILIKPGIDITTEISDQFTERANEHSLFVGLTFQATDLCAPVTATPSV